VSRPGMWPNSNRFKFENLTRMDTNQHELKTGTPFAIFAEEIRRLVNPPYYQLVRIDGFVLTDAHS